MAVEAVLHGTVNARNGIVDSSDTWVEYGLSTNYGATTRSRIINISDRFSDDTTHEVTRYLSGLQRSTTYHYRFVARSQWGTSYGEDATVTTLANLPPVPTDSFTSINGAEPVPIYVSFSDPDNEKVTITSVNTPGHGTVAIGSSTTGASLTYTPDGTFGQTDAFTYTVTDQHGGSATATVHLYDPRKTAAARYILTVVSESAPVRAVGVVGLNVRSNGVFTGTLTYFGERYVLRGRFSTDGLFSTEIDRRGAPPLQLSLGEWGGPNGIQIGGSLDEYTITSDSALISPANAPEAGSYTMALPSEDPAAPVGSGYVTGLVNRHGKVIFTGRIGDGQAFSFGTQLRSGGTADLFITAGSAPRDRIWGRLQFPGAAASESTGELAWYRAPRTSGAFQSGFQTQIHVTGSRLALTDAEEQILDYSTELAGLDIHFSDIEGEDLLDGTLSGPTEGSLAFQGSVSTFTTRGRFPARTAVQPVTIRINRRTGAFSGMMHLPGESGLGHSYSGVLLQHQNTGAGLVRFGPQSGLITLTPK
jgi:hypothetical protein